MRALCVPHSGCYISELGRKSLSLHVKRIVWVSKHLAQMTSSTAVRRLGAYRICLLSPRPVLNIPEILSCTASPGKIFNQIFPYVWYCRALYFVLLSNVLTTTVLQWNSRIKGALVHLVHFSEVVLQLFVGCSLHYWRTLVSNWEHFSVSIYICDDPLSRKYGHVGRASKIREM